MRDFFLIGAFMIVLAIAGGTAYWVLQTTNNLGLAGSSGQNATALEKLDVYGQVPDFALVERSGRQVQLSNLRGKVWIANFFYSQCTETCPIQTANMAMLQKDFAGEPDVRFVGFSVDPEHDTPEFLREYASHYSADPERWLFLTGSKDDIYTLAIKGFKLGVIENPDESEHIHPDGAIHIHKTAAGERVVHSKRFVLVDRQGRIRAYFVGDDNASLQRLHPAVIKLLREK